MSNNIWNPNNFFDRIVKINWLYEKVFWKKLLNNLIYDSEYERSKRLLSQLHWYDNIDEIFWDKVMRDEFKKISKIIFKFYDNGNNPK